MLEVTRYCVGWFLRRAREVGDPCTHAALFNMLDPGRSPVQFSQQYLGSTIMGAAERLLLLWIAAGCGTIEQWIAEFPEQIRSLRRLILCTAGHIFKWHKGLYMFGP